MMMCVGLCVCVFECSTRIRKVNVVFFHAFAHIRAQQLHCKNGIPVTGRGGNLFSLTY